MNQGFSAWLRGYLGRWLEGWDRFWFTPANPATLCLIRILAGSMLVYTHLVWTLELPTFFSTDGIFGAGYSRTFSGNSPFVWSHFFWLDSPLWMWSTHVLSLLTLVAFTIGLATRITGLLSFLIVVSYAHRAGGALFGLDQINGCLALYLAVAPSGLMYSVDAWLRRRKAGQSPPDTRPAETVMANIGIRLMQTHLCIVYLFAGLGKLQGASWWDGTAIWGAFASYEYQTIDMTFLVHLPWIVNLLTLVSVFWELSYPFLIWPSLTRPVWLLLAVAVHLGIGMCMGMMTFGLMMVIANGAFLPPEFVQGTLSRVRRLLPAGGFGQSGPDPKSEHT